MRKKSHNSLIEKQNLSPVRTSNYQVTRGNSFNAVPLGVPLVIIVEFALSMQYACI